MKLSIIVPAKNEEGSIGACLCDLRRVVRETHHISCEIIVVDDASSDGTVRKVRELMEVDHAIRLIEREPPSGFGRAVRAALPVVTGDIVVICMGDGSDDPEDVVRYTKKIAQGYDCVFGSRFVAGARVVNYPPLKRALNRTANHIIQLLFWTRFNDLTNAFKAYRTHVLRECGPYSADHFDLSLEIALAALVRPYTIAQIPIAWTGRTSGRSKLNLARVSIRYLVTIAVLFARRVTEASRPNRRRKTRSTASVRFR